MKGIILAAGYATRLKALAANRPKALQPVHGRPIIDYIADEMDTVHDLDGITVVSNHRFAGQLTAWAAERCATGRLPVRVLDDGSTCPEDRLGAIGDIQFCIRQQVIDDELLVIAGDNLFTYRLRDAWQHYRRHGEDMVLAKALPPSEDLHRYAIAEVDAAGLVVSLEEKPAAPRSNLAVFATYFYRRDTLPLFGEYLESGQPPDAPGHFPAWLVQRRPLRCYLFNGECFDIGTPESYADVMTSFPLSTTDGHH